MSFLFLDRDRLHACQSELTIQEFEWTMSLREQLQFKLINEVILFFIQFERLTLFISMVYASDMISATNILLCSIYIIDVSYSDNKLL